MSTTVARPTAEPQAMSLHEAAAPVTPAQSIAGSSFFKLPPELRNRIYESVLIVEEEEYGGQKSTEISKEGGIPEPGLLAACKTIRDEAIAIYYKQNWFELTIDTFDSAPLVLWKAKKISMLKQYNLQLDDRIYVEWTTVRRNWKNFMLWMQRAHQGLVLDVSELRLEHFRESPEDSSEWEPIIALLKMVERMRNQPWAMVEKLVDDFYDAVNASSDCRNWWSGYYPPWYVVGVRCVAWPTRSRLLPIEWCPANSFR